MGKKMKTITLFIIITILTFSSSTSFGADEGLSFINVENQEAVKENFQSDDSKSQGRDRNDTVGLDKISDLQLMTEDERDAYIARHLAKSTPEERQQFKRRWLAKSKSNELQAAAQKQGLEEKSSSKWEMSESTKDYLHKSGEQILYGNYTDECTGLGTAGEIALGFSGLDAPADIRDLSHDLRNAELSWSWAGKTALDGSSLLPVVGVLKHAGKVKKLAIKALKNGDKTCKITKCVAKNGDAIAEAAQGVLKKASKASDSLQASKKINKVTDVAEGGLKRSEDVFVVTKDGVVLPKGKKYRIPEHYVENPHFRDGSYGEYVNGRFKEKLRIDPATLPGKKGPNYSHYHKNGKRTHYSPRQGDRNPGF